MRRATMHAMTSPDPTPSDRRLRRSGTDRVVSGVAGGIAEHFELDPSLVRIGFGILSLVGGLGLAVYAVFALVLPAEPGAPELTRTHKVALGAIVVAALVSLPFFGGHAFFAGPGALFLVALGVLAWRAVGGSPDERLLKAAIIIVAVCASIAL